MDVEFAGRFDGCASERVGVGGEREGDERELLDRHVGCHRDRRQLSEFDGAFSDDVAAEDGVELTVGDEFAKAGGASVDDRSRQRVEPLGCDDDLAGLAGRRLGESDGGVFGVGEAAEGADLGWQGGRGSEDRVGGRQVRLACCLMDDHHVSGDVAGGEDVRRAGAKLSVHLNVAAWVGLDAGGGKVELGGVGDPADRDDRNRCVDVVRSAVV